MSFRTFSFYPFASVIVVVLVRSEEVLPYHILLVYNCICNSADVVSVDQVVTPPQWRVGDSCSHHMPTTTAVHRRKQITVVAAKNCWHHQKRRSCHYHCARSFAFTGDTQ